jgi:hypothetical protein
MGDGGRGQGTNSVLKFLARISHTASAASCRLRRPAGCSASRLSPLRSGCCGPPPLRSGPNFPWTVGSHAVRREPPGGKSGPRFDARGTLRATLRVVCLRLTSLCSVYLRYAPIRAGCGHGSSLRLATKRYEKSRLACLSHTLRVTLRVVCLRLTSLCSVYLRYAPIRSGCGHGSSPRLATKQYEKCGLAAYSNWTRGRAPLDCCSLTAALARPALLAFDPACDATKRSRRAEL